jgi:hypothetical protein
MWTEIKKVPNLMLAEMWKEYFEGEGVPVQIISLVGGYPDLETAAYQLMVPTDKKHIIDEILRTL